MRKVYVYVNVNNGNVQPLVPGPKPAPRSAQARLARKMPPPAPVRPAGGLTLILRRCFVRHCLTEGTALGQLDKLATRSRRAARTDARTPAHCSFCFKPESGVALLIAGPGNVCICDACVDVCRHLAANRLAAFPGKASIQDIASDRLLALLAPLETAIRSDGGQMRWLVETLRGRKVSWAHIGKALNISRQSAWERFARPDGKRKAWRVLPPSGAADAKPGRAR